MAWTVLFHPDFEPEFAQLDILVRRELLALVSILRERGPMVGRPHADTLVGSKHANMKELRFLAAAGVWRVAFAFDPTRKAIILVAGNKTKMGSHRFYTALIRRADDRFDRHLAQLPPPPPGRGSGRGRM